MRGQRVQSESEGVRGSSQGLRERIQSGYEIERVQSGSEIERVQSGCEGVKRLQSGSERQRIQSGSEGVGGSIQGLMSQTV